MTKFNLIKKIMKKIKKPYFWVLSVFVVCAIAGVAYNIYANPSDDSYTVFDVGMPTRVDGIEKLEYRTYGDAHGSVDGHVNSKFSFGTRVSFLIKFKKNGYSNLLAKDIKVVSDQGTCLGLKTFVQKSQRLRTDNVSDTELIDPNQTYVTDTFTVCKNESFKIEGIKLDEFDATLKLDRSMYSMDEALNVSYEIKHGEKYNAIYNEEKNNYLIKNIKYGSDLKLFVDTTPGFSNSKLKFTNERINLKKSEVDNSIYIYNVKKDMEFTISGLAKNTYKLEFNNYNDVVFKYRKDHSDNEFKELESRAFTVTYGDSYDFVCKTNDSTVLNDKEIVINGVAISSNNGVYHVDNINQDNVISIKDKQEAIYPISLAEDKITLLSKNDEKFENMTVNYGENFEFKISPTDAYTQNIDYAKVYAVPTSNLSGITDSTIENYVLVPTHEYLYTISEVKEPMTLILKNLKKNEYVIDVPEIVKYASYTVEESEEVKKVDNFKYRVVHGSNLKIKVLPDEYKSLEKLNVGCSDKDAKVSSNNNVYTVSNITCDSYIAINNVTDLKHDVIFVGEGFTCYNEKDMPYCDNKSEIICKTGTLKFKVKVNSGYKSEQGKTYAVIKSGNAYLNKIDDEYYQLSDVFSDIEISIEGISKINSEDISQELKEDNIENSSITSEILKDTSSTLYFDTKNLVNKDDKICSVSTVSVSRFIFGEYYENVEQKSDGLYGHNYRIEIPDKTSDETPEKISEYKYRIYLTNQICIEKINFVIKDSNGNEIARADDVSNGSGSSDNKQIEFQKIDDYYEVQVTFYSDNYSNDSNDNNNYEYYLYAEYTPYTESKFIFDTSLFGSTIQHDSSGSDIELMKVPGKDNYVFGQLDFKKINSYKFKFSATSISNNIKRLSFYRDPDYKSALYGISVDTRISNFEPIEDKYKFNVEFTFSNSSEKNFALGDIYIVFNCDDENTWKIADNLIFKWDEDLKPTINFSDGIEDESYEDDNGKKYKLKSCLGNNNDGDRTCQFIFKLTPRYSYYGIKDIKVYSDYDKRIEFQDNEVNILKNNSGKYEVSLTLNNYSKENIYIYIQYYEFKNAYINFLNPSPGVTIYEAEKDSKGNLSKVKELTELCKTIENNSEFYFALEIKDGYIVSNEEILVKENYFTNADNVEIVTKLDNSSGDNKIYYYKVSNLDSLLDPCSVVINISDNAVYKKSCIVSFEGKGCKYYDSDDLLVVARNVLYGENIKFSIKVSEGYSDIKSIKVIDNQKEVEIKNINEYEDKNWKIQKSQSNDMEYEFTGIKTNLKVYAEANLSKKSVRFLESEGIQYEILKPSSKEEERKKNESKEGDEKGNYVDVYYGYNLSFIVKASDVGYDISDIEVFVNNEKSYAVNSAYNLSDIKEDINIRVENVKKAKNKVTFSKRDGITFKDVSSESESAVISEDYKEYDYGTDVNFKIVRSKGYIDSNITIGAEFADGQTFFITIDKDGNQKENEIKNESFYYINDEENGMGTFTVKKLKQNVRIYVTEMGLDSYEIKFPSNEGIEFRDQYGDNVLNLQDNVYTVLHGENFSFRIFAQEGIDLSNIKVYKNSLGQSIRTEIYSVNDVYIMENVVENINIVVEGITKFKYNLEFRKTEGVSCIDPDSGKDIGENASVEYGSNFKFKLSLEQAYSNANPRVAVKGAAESLIKNADGIYTIENITDDKIIEILDVKKNTYIVTFTKTEGIVYKTGKNKVFEGTQEIEYDGIFYFKVSILDAYDESIPWVLLNNEKTLIENSGVYCLENIKSDCVITIKNVVKNKEEVTMENINNVLQGITSESDLDAVVNATLAYESLSNEEKEKVTNLESLKASQDLAGEINHKSEGVEVSGIDWNAKVYVIPLNDNLEQMKSFDEKVDRRTVLSLYEIKLVDVLTGEDYEVEYGKTVSVAIPSMNLVEYKNIVVVHEKKSGSIEYLDTNITSDFIRFETTSFSKFAVAAKKIPNYSEGTSDLQISVSELIEDNNELTTLLGDDISSKLGSIIDKEDIGSSGYNDIGSGVGDDIVDSISNFAGESEKAVNESMEYVYNWAIENEFIAVILILIVGSILIGVIFYIGKKHSKEDSAE